MSWEMVRNRDTEYAVDWGVVHRLLRSHHTADLSYQYAQEITLSDSHWYNPMSWSLPDVKHIEVDWAMVSRYAQANADAELEDMRREAEFDARSVAHKLEYGIERAAQLKELFVDWMGDVQTANMRNIQEAVDDYESHAEVARFFRDRSADGLMVGASVMTGGAAVAVMGGGSILKGTAKFQDTGSVGAGVMEGTGSFVFAYVKLGKKFSFKQDMVLALAQAPWKASTELVGGATLTSAVASGALKLTGPAVDRMFKVGPAKSLFDKVAVPIEISYAGQNVASDTLGKYAGKVAQTFGVEKVGKKLLFGSSAPAPPAAAPAASSRQRRGQLIEQATLTNKYLLHLAFVNMQLGIGRGW